jgi:23S rRNA pseudouridine1911/1915/1917 synthase
VHGSQILFEDNHLLVINKPADWIVQGASPDQRSLLESARMYLKQKYHKPGNVYLGVVSRLDGPVTGAVPFARTSKCAARLSEQFRENVVTKEYWAIVEGAPSPIAGLLEHHLMRRPHETRTRVVDSCEPGSQTAKLTYRILACSGSHSLLSLNLITGRKHQIRCQLAAIGCPILGDRSYGSKESFPQGIALHCRQLEFEHPTTKQTVEIQADVPLYWPSWVSRTKGTKVAFVQSADESVAD